MLRIRTGARHGLRWGLCGFVAALLTISSDRGDAAPYADIVVDANSGNVLHSTNPDARRHPASLTKIMTLYLLFEQLEAGKLKLDSQMKVSAEAAGQDPTKLGLKVGGTLQVEDAIKGIITRSANDAAVVVAEAIAGDEDEFAKLMTRKALALGMTHTVYRNASGLPDDDQVTTARDQSTLGRAIQERFPKYYKYFSIRSFTFRGETIGNHNHLLGSVDGVDGIKTGYIGASGFNLVTSVHRGNRYLVAVVMGGSSAGQRDARMRELISDKIAQASTRRTTPMVAEGFTGDTQEAKVETKSEPKAETKVAKVEPKAEPKADSKPERKVAVAIIDPKDEPKAESKPEAKAEASKPRFAVASSTSVPVRLTQAPARQTSAPQAEPAVRVTTGSTDPIRPVMVRTVTVHAGPQTAAPAALSTVTLPAAIPHSGQVPAPATKPEPKVVAKPEPKVEAKPEPKIEAKPEPKVEPKIEAKPEPKPEPKSEERFALASSVSVPARFVPPPAAPAPTQAVAEAAPAPAPTAPAATTSAASVTPAPAAAKPQPQARSGWMIQVGAYQAEQEAKQRLTSVQSKAAKVLSGADPFTETVDKGGTTYYRARFAGLDKDKAEAACKYLKRNDVECVAIKN
jgi:D-alanyl-D-alanine carboxypeptidase